MLCNNCGNNIREGEQSCPICGNTNIYVNQNTNINQPFNNGQVMMNQPINQAYPQNYMNGVPSAPKKNNSWIFILVGVAILALIIFGFIKYSNSKEKNDKEDVNYTEEYHNNSNTTTSNSNSGVSNSNTTTSNSNGGVSSNSNTTTPSGGNTQKPSTVKTITFKGYAFNFPTNYSTSVTTSDQLQVISVDRREVYVYDTIKGSYDTLRRNTSSIKDTLSKSGYAVSNLVIKNYNNVEFITAEVRNNNNAMLVGYSKIDDSTVLMVVAANTSQTIDYSLINNAANIKKTIKKI